MTQPLKFYPAGYNKIKDPFNTFNPMDRTSYPSGPGIYVFGLRHSFKDDSGKTLTKFLPMYVGKHETNIGARLYEHYLNERMPGNSCKAIFNWAGTKSLQDIRNIYDDINIYDNVKGNHKKRHALANLIWFNNKDFFEHKFTGSKSLYVSGSGCLTSLYPVIGDLDLINTTASKQMKESIIKTKELVKNNYFFIFANIEKLESKKAVKSELDILERCTKEELNKSGLFTYSSAINTKTARTIDFTDPIIQNNLIAL